MDDVTIEDENEFNGEILSEYQTKNSFVFKNM
jgi:hypothetical protein